MHGRQYGRSSGLSRRKLEDDLGEIARVEPLQSISEHGQQNHRQRLMDADRLLRMSKLVTKVAVLYGDDGTAVFEICESCATKVKTPLKREWRGNETCHSRHRP